MTTLTHEQVLKVGREQGLSGRQLTRFAEYVETRNFIRDDYYIREWAERFSKGDEYARSDREGLALLDKIDARDKMMRNQLRK